MECVVKAGIIWKEPDYAAFTAQSGSILWDKAQEIGCLSLN